MLLAYSTWRLHHSPISYYSELSGYILCFLGLDCSTILSFANSEGLADSHSSYSQRLSFDKVGRRRELRCHGMTSLGSTPRFSVRFVYYHGASILKLGMLYFRSKSLRILLRYFGASWRGCSGSQAISSDFRSYPGGP